MSPKGAVWHLGVLTSETPEFSQHLITIKLPIPPMCPLRHCFVTQLVKLGRGQEEIIPLGFSTAILLGSQRCRRAVWLNVISNARGGE